MMIKSLTSTHDFCVRFALWMVLAAAPSMGEVAVHGAMSPYTPLHFQYTVSERAGFANGSEHWEPAPVAPGANHAGATTAFIGPGWG